MRDKWADLWDIATDDPDGRAEIIPDVDDPNEVTLRWADGSHERLYWCWASGCWEFEEQLQSTPWC